MHQILEELPPEVIGNVFRFVPLKDLCKVVLASTLLRTLASQPKLWRGMTVDKDKIHQDGLPQLFAIDRFKQVRKIDLSFMAFTTEELLINLNAIASSSVRELDLNSVNLEEVPAELLAQVAAHLERIDLEATWLTTEQCLALMNVCISSSTLIEVNFIVADLDEVPAELLAEAVGNLKKVNLDYANLTTQQMIAVLKVCISSSSLIDVSLSYTDLDEVPAELLAEAVGHLRIVNLAYLGLTGMSTEQCLGVLKACISSFTLTDVDLAGNNLRMIPEEFLGNAVGHLEKVSLHSTQMTTGQCVAVLEVCVSSSKLIDVNMELADREIPVELLARAASNLQTINFK